MPSPTQNNTYPDPSDVKITFADDSYQPSGQSNAQISDNVMKQAEAKFPYSLVVDSVANREQAMTKYITGLGVAMGDSPFAKGLQKSIVDSSLGTAGDLAFQWGAEANDASTRDFGQDFYDASEDIVSPKGIFDLATNITKYGVSGVAASLFKSYGRIAGDVASAQIADNTDIDLRAQQVGLKLRGVADSIVSNLELAPEYKDVASRFAYDLGAGAGSVLTSVGLGMVAGPGTGAAYFGLIQKAQIAKEAASTSRIIDLSTGNETVGNLKDFKNTLGIEFEPDLSGALTDGQLSKDGKYKLSQAPMGAREAGLVGWKAAIPEAGLEFVGLHTILKGLRGFKPLQRIFLISFEQALQEAGQQGAEEYLAKKEFNRAGTMSDVWKRVGYAAFLGMILGVPTGAISTMSLYRSGKGQLMKDLNMSEEQADGVLKDMTARIIDVTADQAPEILNEMLAPYGVKFQIKEQTSTPEFKNWFGDSKVVDEKGQPLAIYSGHSNVELYGSKYEPKKSTAGGYYASEDPDIASNYSLGKFGSKEYYENGDQYRLAGKNGQLNKKIWQVELNDEQKAKLDELAESKNEYGDDLSGIGEMKSWAKNNEKYDPIAKRLVYDPYSLYNIFLYMEQMGYNIAYADTPEGGDAYKPLVMRQNKNRFEEILDELGIKWNSYYWQQPGVQKIYLKIENPLDASQPFPQDLLLAIKEAAKGERSKSSEHNDKQWTKNFPLKEWIAQIESGSEFWTTHIPKKALPIIKSFGYDGIKELGLKGTDKPQSERQINWIAFDPTQIKSATGNKGSFDENNPDIRFQKDSPKENIMKAFALEQWAKLKDLIPANYYAAFVDLATNDFHAFADTANKLIVLTKDLKENTVPHEVFHVVYAELLTEEERALLSQEVYYNSGLTDEVEVEEFLADRFAEHWLGRDARLNSIGGKIKQFIIDLANFIKSFAGVADTVEEVFNDVMNKKKEIQSQDITEEAYKISQQLGVNIGLVQKLLRGDMKANEWKALINKLDDSQISQLQNMKDAALEAIRFQEKDNEESDSDAGDLQEPDTSFNPEELSQDTQDSLQRISETDDFLRQAERVKELQDILDAYTLKREAQKRLKDIKIRRFSGGFLREEMEGIPQKFFTTESTAPRLDELADQFGTDIDGAIRMLQESTFTKAEIAKAVAAREELGQITDELSRKNPAIKEAVSEITKLSPKLELSEKQLIKRLFKERFRGEKIGFREGREQATKEIMQDKEILARRRARINGIKEMFGLSDSELKKINRRDIRLMSNYEFKLFVDDIEALASALAEKRQLKNQIAFEIQDKELKKVDNLRAYLELPSLDDMSIEQLVQFSSALEETQKGDEFLSVRKLETVENTELGNIKTIREAKEVLAKKLGISLEEVDNIKVSGLDKFRYDTALARQNPFYKLLVDDTNTAMLEAESKFLKMEQEVDILTRKARASKKQGLMDKLAPTDELVFKWMEAKDKTEIAKQMTPAELDLANYLQARFAQFRDYLIQEGVLKKYKENYITHIRRGFLETVKADGIITAFKEVFSQYKEDQTTFTILDDDTQNILPLEKFFQFSMKRTGELKPSENVSSAFKAYTKAMLKKQALDKIVPALDIYAHALSPTELTPNGLEMDRRLVKFVREWINNKKGRKSSLGGFVPQGGTIDLGLRMIDAFVTFLDLGFNIPVGLTANIGEQVVTYVNMGTAEYAKGVARAQTKKGKQIIKDNEAFVGKTLWSELAETSDSIGNKFNKGLYGLFHISSVNANSVHLLGSLTDAEWESGKISNERLAVLKREMGRMRAIPGAKSIAGSTSVGGALAKYKSWAIPVFSTVIDDIGKLSSMVSKGEKGVTKTQEFQELFRATMLTTMIGLAGKAMIGDDDDDSFLGKLLKKAYRESMTMLGAMDPTVIFAEPRIISFFGDLASSLKLIVTLEKYKSKARQDEFKGVTKLGRTLKPKILSQFEKPKRKKGRAASLLK